MWLILICLVPVTQFFLCSIDIMQVDKGRERQKRFLHMEGKPYGITNERHNQ